MLSACAAPKPPPASFTERQAEQHAQLLLADYRYAEAISLLTGELETLPTGAPRLSMLLLLADAQLGIGDLDAAEATLTDAEQSASSGSGKNAVAKRRSRLSEMRQIFVLPVQVSGAVDSSKAHVDTTRAPPLPESLITNSYFETDLRQVLTDLSTSAGVPIIWDNTVQGLVTFEAVDRPLVDVLRSILLPAGFVYSYQQGTYFVGSPKPENPAFGLLSTTEVVTLSSIDATKAIELLSDYFKPYVRASQPGNIVCISAPPSFAERIRADLTQIDRPPIQILIEVVVSEISTDALRQMGLDWSLLGAGRGESFDIKADHTHVDGAAIVGKFTTLGNRLGEFSVDLAASLEALVQSGKARIRANPRIAVLNGRTAEISLTKDQYFVIATSISQFTQYNTIQAVSSGIKLEITPYASPSGEITVHVKPEVGDVVGQGANALPEINRRTASTTVRVKTGETFTIGGLGIQKEKKIQKKIPLLGEIPILGRFFRYDETSLNDTQIVIFVTPWILKG